MAKLNIGDLVSLLDIHEDENAGTTEVLVVKPGKNGDPHIGYLIDPENEFDGSHIDEFEKPKGLAAIAKSFKLDANSNKFIEFDSEHIDGVHFNNTVKPLTKSKLKVGLKVKCLYPNSSNYGRTGKISKITNETFEVDWDNGRNTGRVWTVASNFEEHNPAKRSLTGEEIYANFLDDNLDSLANLEAEAVPPEVEVSSESIQESIQEDIKIIKNRIDQAASIALDEMKILEKAKRKLISKIKSGDRVKIRYTSFDEDDEEIESFVDGTVLEHSPDVSDGEGIPGTFVFLDKPITTTLGGSYSWQSENEDIVKVAKDLKLNFKKDDRFFLIDDDDIDCEIVSVNVKKGDKKIMSENKLMDTVKKDFESAAYRVASTQLTNGVKAGILLAFKDKGMDETKLSVVKEIFESEFGNALISVAIGYGLTYAPHISEDDRVKRLAGEFRVQGMAIVGNEVIGTAVQYLMPAFNSALQALPPASTMLPEALQSKKTRVAEDADEGEEVDVEEESGKTHAA